MSAVSVIYRAPQGDTKVVEWQGHTFFDGKPTEIDSDDPANAAILEKLIKHPLFEVSAEGTATEEVEEQPEQRRSGRRQRERGDDSGY